MQVADITRSDEGDNLTVIYTDGTSKIVSILPKSVDYNHFDYSTLAQNLALFLTRTRAAVMLQNTEIITEFKEKIAILEKENSRLRDLMELQAQLANNQIS